MSPNTDERLRQLEADGLLHSIVRLAAGDLLHPAFWHRCEPPWKLEAGGRAPAGPPFVVLWEQGDLIEGYWRQDGQLEFISFDIEAPDRFKVIAHTQQGLLAHVFADLYEWERDDLQGAAASAGFLHLDALIAFLERTNGQLEYPMFQAARAEFIMALTDG